MASLNKNYEDLIQLFSEDARLNKAFLGSVGAKETLKINEDKFSVSFALDSMLEYSNSNAKFDVNPENDKEWNIRIKHVNDSEGNNTYLGIRFFDEIRNAYIDMISKSEYFLFLNDGTWLQQLWSKETADTLKKRFAEKDDLFFIATSGTKIHKENNQHPVIETLLEFQEKGRGLVYKLKEQAPLHFSSYTAKGFGTIFVRGYFKNWHNEEEKINKILKWHEFKKIGTYFLFSSNFLDKIIKYGENTKTLSDYGNATVVL